MPLMFNMLLEDAGISPSDVRLLRHQTGKVPGRSPYTLWRDDVTAFEQYQSTQDPAKRGSERVSTPAIGRASFPHREVAPCSLGSTRLTMSVPLPMTPSTPSPGSLPAQTKAKATTISIVAIGPTCLAITSAAFTFRGVSAVRIEPGSSAPTARIRKLSNSPANFARRRSQASRLSHFRCPICPGCRSVGERRWEPHAGFTFWPVRAPGNTMSARPMAQMASSAAGWTMSQPATAEMPGCASETRATIWSAYSRSRARLQAEMTFLRWKKPGNGNS